MATRKSNPAIRPSPTRLIDSVAHASPPGYPAPPKSTTRQVGTLEQAIQSQSDRLSAMGAALDQLEQAMSLVLIPVGPEPMPTGNAGPSVAEPPQSPAVHVLHDLSQRAELLINRINGLASRVQA